MVSRPRDLADRMAARRQPDDGYLRETFTLPRDRARTRARDFLTRFPKAADMSGVESGRELLGGEPEFTLRRRLSAESRSMPPRQRWAPASSAATSTARAKGPARLVLFPAIPAVHRSVFGEVGRCVAAHLGHRWSIAEPQHDTLARELD